MTSSDIDKLADSVNLPLERVAEFCTKWGVVEFAIFGSSAIGAQQPDSDLDVLVTFSEASTATLLDLVEMQTELESLVGRRVDLVSRRAVERSGNYLRKTSILESARVLFAA